MKPTTENATFQNEAGDYLKLSIEGYQYPDTEYEYYDSNWLLINGELSHQGSIYQFTDPCLMTRDVAEMSDWLEQVANGTVKDGRLGFTEPSLAFEATIENKFIVSTWVMASPTYPHTGPEELLEISINFPIVSEQLKTAADSLRVQLNNFPIRTQ